MSYLEDVKCLQNIVLKVFLYGSSVLGKNLLIGSAVLVVVNSVSHMIFRTSDLLVR